jgi:hypothetical protein
VTVDQLTFAIEATADPLDDLDFDHHERVVEAERATGVLAPTCQCVPGPGLVEADELGIVICCRCGRRVAGA